MAQNEVVTVVVGTMSQKTDQGGNPKPGKWKLTTDQQKIYHLTDSPDFHAPGTFIEIETWVYSPADKPQIKMNMGKVQGVTVNPALPGEQGPTTPQITTAPPVNTTATGGNDRDARIKLMER